MCICMHHFDSSNLHKKVRMNASPFIMGKDRIIPADFRGKTSRRMFVEMGRRNGMKVFHHLWGSSKQKTKTESHDQPTQVES